MGYAFISYSSKDQEKANAIRSIFLNNNISCWMAPYDIPAGTKYAYVINDAIKDAACLVLLFTNASQESIFVEKEVERAVANGKPIITMELERVVLNSGYQFYLGNQQIIATPKINEDDENFQRALQGIAAFTGRTDTLKKKTQLSAANETATVQNAGGNKKHETVSRYSNPRIVEDASMKSGQKVTWDCIWFGSYPQSEVVCETNTGRISELKSNDNQYAVVSRAQWKKITGAVYDRNGEVVVDGVKYKRLSKTEANYATSGNSCYYEWGDFRYKSLISRLSTRLLGDDIVRYFRYEPIKWRVLDVNENDALLVADKGLDDQKYNTAGEDVTWETCTMRSWLNGYDSSVNRHGTDYSCNNFINAAFTASERSAIKTIEVVNGDNTHFSAVKTVKVVNGGNINFSGDGGNNTSDKIFLLSENQVYNSSTAFSYGFVENSSTNDEARRCKSSTYAKAMGVRSNTGIAYAGNCWWWLRSPGSFNYFAAYVDDLGGVCYGGFNVGCYNIAVRPALHLDLSYSNLYCYAGTVSSDGSKDNL